jgi:hypothetical protein
MSLGIYFSLNVEFTAGAKNAEKKSEGEKMGSCED